MGDKSTRDASWDGPAGWGVCERRGHWQPDRGWSPPATASLAPLPWHPCCSAILGNGCKGICTPARGCEPLRGVGRAGQGSPRKTDTPLTAGKRSG